MERIGSVLIVPLLLIIVATPAHARFGRNKIQYRSYDWKILHTPHFEIHFYAGAEAFAVRTALVMEDGYKMLSDKLDVGLPWKVPVILYGSHNDFLQTNVITSQLPEGVQAFAEPSRKRIVLPFTASFKDFSHTAIHELSHVFTFQIVYNRLLDNVFSRNALFGMPLWVAEGVAEYLSVGWDAESDMFIRDAVIHDYLPDLQYAGGFMVYKAGQSVFNYIEDTYGQEKVVDILQALAAARSGDGALNATIGLTTGELSAKWQKAMRKRYWPAYGDKTEAEEFGRPLTNHIADRAYYNTKPVLSPDGEKIAFFSDRNGLMSIFVMSTFDGKIIKKLVAGHTSSTFESLHFFTSSLDFSPDGSMLTFVAKSNGRDALFIIDSDKGRIRKKLKVEADGLALPAWSPNGDAILVTATFSGQTDLVLVNVNTGECERLTNDPADQLDASFFPDGRRIVFTYYPEITAAVPTSLSAIDRRTLNEMNFLADDNVKHGETFDIYEMDLETRAIRPIIQTPGDDEGAVVFDGGRKMIFSSDESGVSNLYLADLENGGFHRITDALGGLFTPAVNEEKGRIAFAAFRQMGYDIFISEDLGYMLQQSYGEPVPAVATTKAAEEPKEAVRPSLSAGAMGFATLMARSGKPKDDPDEDDGSFAIVDPDSVLPEDLMVSPISMSGEASVTDTKKEGASTTEGVGVPVHPLDEPINKGATVSEYKLKLAPDFVGQGGGLYYSTGYGFGLANTIAMSDLLGNHRMVFSFNLFRDIAESDILATYYYLARRIDYGIGVYQFKHFLNSRVSSIGESFQDYTVFSERNYGMFGLVSIPLNTFYRVDLEMQAFVSERQFFEQTEEDPLTGQLVYVESSTSTRHLIEPTISLVHDASFFNMYGPVSGSRWNLSVSKGVELSDAGVDRATAYVDYRKYFRLWYRNSLAFRAAFAATEGEDPRTFFLGGPTTLRGYDYLAFQGQRLGLMSVEYRFPLIDALILGFPGRWGFQYIAGNAFFDIGAAWDKGALNFLRNDINGLALDDVRADVGFGASFYLGYFLLNFQLAYQTDLRTIGHSHFHFFLGPGF